MNKLMVASIQALLVASSLHEIDAFLSPRTPQVVVATPRHTSSSSSSSSSSTGMTTTATAIVVETVDDATVVEARTTMPRIVDRMPPPIPSGLNNRYYLLRHGQSTANVAGIISSSRSLAHSDEHGLTALGYEQGKASASLLLDALEAEGAEPGEKVIFLSSPFARARETAEACLDGLLSSSDARLVLGDGALGGLEISTEILLENRLMERYFGKLDGEAIDTYAYVWPLDKFNATHTAFDVESVAAVSARLSSVVERCEEEFGEGRRRNHVVWVSHADVLQIGQLYAANADNVGLFSSYRFKNGEVRAMKRTPDSLPEPLPLEAPERGTGTARLQ